MSALWIAVAVVAALSSQDLRGPLASIVDLDLAGHTTLARERFLSTEALIRDAGLDPDLLRPPATDAPGSLSSLSSLSSPSPSPDPSEATASATSINTLNTLLNEHGRDDTARAYYSLLFHARRGERKLALEAGDRLTSLRNTTRSAALIVAITTAAREVR